MNNLIKIKFGDIIDMALIDTDEILIGCEKGLVKLKKNKEVINLLENEEDF